MLFQNICIVFYPPSTTIITKFLKEFNPVAASDG